MEKLLEIKNELFSSIRQLRASIDAAMHSMSKMYGENHYAIKRLQSYYPALDKQMEYVNQLHDLVLEKKYDEYMSMTAKIEGISDMIKLDAKSLLNSLTTGKDIIPENDNLN